MTRVKICGITSLADALAACEAGADALGFNFAPEARARNRYIDPEQARDIIRELPPFITTVGITVNAAEADLKRYLEFVDLLQLHGEETPEQCEPFADRVIKVFWAGPQFQAESMLRYPVKAYLLDARVPGAHGGTGHTCDWEAAATAVSLGKAIVLAGGLRPDNVAEAIRRVRPYAVDTASGVESAPGKKDHERIRSFVQNAKQCVPG